MSADSGFADRWPLLSGRLNALLARRCVPHHARADIAQETAIVLLERWDELDNKDDLWPLTATIGLNALRNEARRVARSTPSLTIEDDDPLTCTTEEAVLAREELRRVATLLGDLTPSQRTALLTALDEERGPQSVATRMTRMRARRRLRDELGQAGFGTAVVRWSGISSWRRLSSGVTRHARQLETLAQPLIVVVIGAATALGWPSADGSLAPLPTGPATNARVTQAAVASDRVDPVSRVAGRPSPASGSGRREQSESPFGAEPVQKGHRSMHVFTPAGRCSLEGCEVEQSWSRVEYAGQRVRYRGSGSVRPLACLHDPVSGEKPSGCASVEVEAEVNGERRRVRVGT